MTDFSKGSIYEYIQNKFDELKKRDGKYSPKEHDNLVFELTANHFNIDINEVEKIFKNYDKLAAKKLILKLNRLPKKERQVKQEQIMTDIIKNNGDLPFADIEGPPTSEIISSLNIIYEEYLDIATIIGQNGWTIPMNMGLSKLDSLKCKEITNDVLDDFFVEYYSIKKFNLLIKHVRMSEINETLKNLFNDCIEVYNSDKYLLCSASLLTILEGVLCEFGEDKTDIRMMRICRYNMDKTKDDNKVINHLIWVSMFNFIKNLYEKSKFDEEEPEQLNRHWILHGRTQNELIKADCLRLFNIIYALINMLKYKQLG